MKVFLITFLCFLVIAKACNEMCSSEFIPVCATNGMTFPNQCILEREACLSNSVTVTLAAEGPCVVDECPEICADNYEPVCAVPGIQFPNFCEFLKYKCQQNLVDLPLPKLGACPAVSVPCADLCPADYSPICGSDGLTYSNLCVLQRKACLTKTDLTSVHEGECTEADCNTRCTKELREVCGSDGQTYSNLCLLQQQQCLLKTEIFVAYEGRCIVDEESPCDTICTADYSPICGNNGQTYSNLCTLKQQACLTKTDITALHDGECTAADEGCAVACPMIYQPVCGTDGQTYSNPCTLESAACTTKTDITVLHDGECTAADEGCAMACPMIYQPVCGTDGFTYPNLCHLEVNACVSKSTITVLHDGECTAADAPCEVRPCAMIYQPVCGTDGQTYSNPCTLESAACAAKSGVTIAHDGECAVASDEDCAVACPMIYEPVCGNNGRTYGNLCGLQVAACQLKTQISILHQGECETADCAVACAMIYEPVCGTDGQTYSNLCTLDQQACSTKSGVNVAYNGECTVACNMRCTKELKPVCGSNYVTYDNECMMQLSGCEKQVTLTVLHEGACQPGEQETETEAETAKAGAINTTNQPDSNNMSTGMIVGITGLVVGVLAAVVIAAVIVRRRRVNAAAASNAAYASLESASNETPYSSM